MISALWHVYMPKLDGLEAARIIWQEASDFPILGHSNDEALSKNAWNRGWMGSFRNHATRIDSIRPSRP